MTVNQWNGCVGTKAPGRKWCLFLYAITIFGFYRSCSCRYNYTGQASSWRSGGTVTYNVGPGYVKGNATIGGSNTVILTGNLYIRSSGKDKGALKIEGGGLIKGPYSIITDGDFTVSGGATALLAAGNIPFVIVQGTNVGITHSTAVAAVIYAPNAAATVSGGTNAIGYNLYGSLIAKSVNISGSTTIKYMAGIYSKTQIPARKAVDQA